jgi:hypothetical protein
MAQQMWATLALLATSVAVVSADAVITLQTEVCSSQRERVPMEVRRNCAWVSGYIWLDWHQSTSELILDNGGVFCITLPEVICRGLAMGSRAFAGIRHEVTAP